MALIRLLQKHQELTLPADLTRVKIVRVLKDPGNKAKRSMIASESVESSWRIEPELEEEAENAVAELVKVTRGKRVVFFVDEFAATSGEASDGLDENALAFFRRSLMNTGACVVVASTDSGMVNMKPAASTNASAKDPDSTPWVKLCIRLPRYVADKSLLASVRKIQDLGVQKLLNLCLRSRPRFADAFATALLPEFLANWPQPEKSKGYLLQFVERVRESVGVFLWSKTDSLREDGCVGYLLAMLTAGYCLEDKPDDKRNIIKNLSTKNWAYLVNERNLFIKNALDKTQKDKKKKEEKENEDTEDERKVPREVQVVDPDWLFIELYREYGNIGGHDELFYKTNVLAKAANRRFDCATYFPDPADDFLLYLVLAGTALAPGLRVRNSECSQGTKPDRISTAKLWRKVFHKPQPRPPSPRRPLCPTGTDSKGWFARRS